MEEVLEAMKAKAAIAGGGKKKGWGSQPLGGAFLKMQVLAHFLIR